MNLFDQLVDEALKNQPSLTSLRIVVEKELLHHDILRILKQNNFLKEVTFIGGTSLRTCYGSVRLSEDLDFTGGKHFSRDSLSDMGRIITESLYEKYGLEVVVSEPKKDINNVDTWKVKVETRPEQKHLPAQRINIDICAVSSYERQPMVLLNPYGVDMGTGGLIVQVESREEIFADKVLAFAMRPNRIKHRDLWDMVWLHQQGLKPKLELIPIKLQDRKITSANFMNSFDQRCDSLTADKQLTIEFNKEMRRFLSLDEMDKILAHDELWSFIVYLMNNIGEQLHSC